MSKLYLVPTPIGNLEDMSFRAIRILKEVDLILAEDTRNSGKLLKHFDISTPMLSHHMHNEHKTVEGLVKRIKSGERMALISAILMPPLCLFVLIGMMAVEADYTFITRLTFFGEPVFEVSKPHD